MLHFKWCLGWSIIIWGNVITVKKKNKIQNYVHCQPITLWKNSIDLRIFKSIIFSICKMLFNVQSVFQYTFNVMFLPKALSSALSSFKTFVSKAKRCAWKDLQNISIIKISNCLIHYHFGYKCWESSTYGTWQLKHTGNISVRALSASILILPLAPIRNHSGS